MAFYEMLPGAGMPSGLQAGMDSVLNKKFGTSTTYPAEDWPDTVNLMGPLPEKTASGAIVTFSDGADAVPLKKCEVTLPASLDGYSEVDVVSAGKNIMPKLKEGTYSGNGIDITVDSNGIATFSGTTTASGNVVIIPLDSEIEVTQDIIDKWYYHMNNSVANGGFAPTLESAEDTGTISFAPSPANRVSSIPSGALGKKINRCRIWSGNGISISGTYAPAFMVESTATDYEPYTAPTTHTASLGRTIHGGTVDVVKGQGESLCGKIVFDGSSDENWTAYAGGNGYLIAVADMERGTWYTSEFAESSPLPKVPDNNSLGVRIGVNNNGVYVVQANTISGVTDLASFKAYLAENPLTVIYPLDDSETFTFDPISIDSKLGANTLWSEQGDSEVTYRADINLALGGH